jgi:hypothetical protein
VAACLARLASVEVSQTVDDMAMVNQPATSPVSHVCWKEFSL